MCVPQSVSRKLAGAGHDVLHMRDIDPRACDGAIVAKAKEEGRVVVTMDLDFGEIMVHLSDTKPSIVLFRLRHPTPNNLARLLEEVIDGFEDTLESGAVVIVEDGRYRIRRLPVS